MTDVIGTADPDAPSRRRLRIPRWLTWGLVAALVMLAVVVPAARGKLAHRAAAWVRSEWARSTSYDDARFIAIEAVESRAGALDDAIVEQAARTTDREEASALQRIADAMTRHRVWAADVDRARDAAVAAIRDQASALRRDAAAPRPSTGYLFAPGHEELAARARSRVDELVHHYGLPALHTATVTLRPDQAALEQLRRVTDFPTGLSLLVSGAESPDILDLDSGRRTALRLPSGDSEVDAWSGRIMLVSKNGVQAVDAHGQAGAHFGDRYAEVLSRTGDTVWLSDHQRVRQYDATGRALTPWISAPPGEQPVAATGDVVVLLRVADEVTFAGELWNPMTGSTHPLPPSCVGGWSAAATTIVPLPCGGDRQIVSLDTRTLTEHRVQLRRPLDDTSVDTFNPLSPTGRRLAVGLTGQGVQPGLIDLHSGRFRPVPGDGQLFPVGWSADGEWVLLADQGAFGNGRRPQVALWRPSDGRVTSIRLEAGSSLFGGSASLLLRTAS